MTDLQAFARLARWAGRSFAANLGGIPEEKLNWQPAPGVKSAAAVTAEVVGLCEIALPLLHGQGWGEFRLQLPATIEEGRQRVLAASEAYAAALEAATPASLERVVETGIGPGTVLIGSARRGVAYPLVDLIHHNGQICYLQSLLGDEEIRFDLEASREAFS
jgi:hypothetical protein